jgi:hypothetical protein
MDERRPETVIDVFDDLYMWLAAKPGMTLFGSYFGSAMLTSERFLFLSAGTGVGKQLFGIVGGSVASLTLGQTTTDQLDLGALRNEGSLSGGLHHITSTRVGWRWDFSSYLVVETAGTRSLPAACSFMTRFGQSRSRLLAFRQTLESIRFHPAGR